MDFSIKYKPLFKLNKNVRYIVVTGGRGSGKSTAVSHFIHNKMFETDNVILHTRVTMTSAKISVIPEFQKVINNINTSDFFAINRNQIINTYSKATLNFKGLKTGSLIQTAQLKSVTDLNIWVLDEAEELHDEGVFDDIDESIRRLGYQNIVILVLNTYRITKTHFIYKRFFENAGVQGGFNGLKGNTLYIHTSYLDNYKNLNKSFLSVIQHTKKTNFEKYEYRYLGKFRDKSEGVIFAKWSYGSFDKSLPAVYGMDFGVLDPDCLVKVAVDRKAKKLYIHEVFYENNLSTEQLKSKVYKFLNKKDLVVADSSGKRTIKDLQDLGFNFVPSKKGDGSVVEGIKKILSFDIIITPESVNLAIELNNYSWSDKKAEIPIDAYNHAIDPVRYTLEKLVKDTAKMIRY